MKRFLPLLLVPLLTACNGANTLTLYGPTNDRQVVFQVEVADEDDERITGLMHRETLGDDHGMLFVFPQADMLSFWMRETLIPLDIIYFNENGAFINAYTMQPCTTEECEQYKSAEPSPYALEINAGEREARGIGVGWRIDPKEVEKMANPK